MYQDRRQRNLPPEHFIDEQLAQWRWDSHLWRLHQFGRKCIWCGWQPPTEMPLDHATLCPHNPVIKSHVQAIGDKIAQALRDSMTDVKGGDL